MTTFYYCSVNFQNEVRKVGHSAQAELPIYRAYARGPSVFRGMTTYVFTKNLKQKIAVFAVQNNTQVFELFDELRVLINQLITCINKSVPVP